MKQKTEFSLSITTHTIWILLGILCILSAVGVAGELLTWWLFGIGIILGGIFGVIITVSMYRKS